MQFGGGKFATLDGCIYCGSQLVEYLVNRKQRRWTRCRGSNIFKDVHTAGQDSILTTSYGIQASTRQPPDKKRSNFVWLVFSFCRAIIQIFIHNLPKWYPQFPNTLSPIAHCTGMQESKTKVHCHSLSFKQKRRFRVLINACKCSNAAVHK